MNNPRTLTYRFQVEGAAACFRRPEFAEDFISYDVMPPFVAARILGSIYLPDGGEWRVRYIDVLKPIRFKRDRIVGARRERRGLVLDDVAYVIAADLVGTIDNSVDHHTLLHRATAEKPSVHLGLASFTGTICVLSEEDGNDVSLTPMMHDLGWMLYEIRNVDTKLPSFFRAQLRNGRVDMLGDLLMAV